MTCDPRVAKRRAILFRSLLLWGAVVIAAGTYEMIWGDLSTGDVAFVGTVTALLNMLMTRYFPKIRETGE